MNDGDLRDHLDAKHERNLEQPIEGIKRWVEYIRAEPPEKWGSQQNAVVDDQLDAAQAVETSAAHQQRVRRVAREIAESQDDPDDDPA